MELEGYILGFQIVGDAQNRCYADAPCQQNGPFRTAGNTEAVPGQADLQGVAHMHLSMQRLGPTPAIAIVPYTNNITVAFRCTVA